jgi:hypothetical protein
MKFTLEINMDNAAFDTGVEGDKARSGVEVWKILNELATKIYNSYSLETGDDGQVRDTNGNKVGTWEVTE